MLNLKLEEGIRGGSGWGGDKRVNMGLEMCEGGCGKENGEDITCNW